MAEPYTGEIRMFGGNFAPRSWALCDGQLMAVNQNDALFSLLGTIYGGDGRTTFGLPDLRGRVPIHAGDGPGLSNRRLGAKAGQEKVTLTVAQLPTHTHDAMASSATATSATPGNTVMPATVPSQVYTQIPQNLTGLSSNAISSLGGSRDHTNLMPYQCVNFIIALYGVYPSRH